MDNNIDRIYTEGVEFELKSKVDLGIDEDTTSCKITRFFEPPTLSCVMEIGPVTVAKETAFGDCVKSGDASKFVDRLRNDEDFEEPEEGWNMGENEAYLYDLCLDMYEAEVAVYQKLEQLQGKEIPRLLAQVRLQPTTAFGTMPSDAMEFFEIKGVLIELIDGYTLSEMLTKAPREDWGDICHEAVRVVRLLDDYSILNKDVRPSNMMITGGSTRDNYRVVMLDFAQCVFRELEETDKQWGRKKWNQDEEGAIGLVMRHRLKQLDYDFWFDHSNHFLEWAETEFPSDESENGEGPEPDASKFSQLLVSVPEIEDRGKA
ncbi:hypothetical protein OCU04_010002 [Sclerotinia nivalis]|uniref:Protein kinase domain-containing protein n=1 Tax=Sclerotinia nivalis TaxID=352851 RepID=A0A9X0ADU4_9HELO|nr:hypothetical protein OCU04_010002 [Sclerotinia nivalis]